MEHGQDFGHRPQYSRSPPEGNLQKKLGFLAAKAYADVRKPCAQPRTQFGNPSTPIGSDGSFQAGGQAPPIHRVTNPLQGEFNGIPGQSSPPLMIR